MKTLLILTSLLVIIFAQCHSTCLLCLSPPVCSLCLPAYALTIVGQCTPASISNCRVYASASTCQICQSTYRVVNGACQKDTTGCLVRSAEGNCLFCGFGTTLIGNTCQGVLNCQQNISNGVCTSCRRGYILQLDRCVDNRTECLLQSAGVCSQCQSNYILNGFSCLPVGVIPPNCDLYDDVKGYCLVCSQGYQMHHRFCQRIDRITPYGAINQAITTSALQMPTDTLGTDTATLASKKVGQDNILPSNLNPSISTFGSTKGISSDSCWLRDTNNLCLVCKQGYNLFQGACSKLPPACLKYSSDMRQCLECDPILTLQSGGCVDVNCAVGIFSRCTVCKDKQYSPNAQGICINTGCLQMVAGKCQICTTGTTIDAQGLCHENSQSTTSSGATNNSITTSNQNSTSTIRNCNMVQGGVCVSCASGFFPDGNGGCHRVIIGCLRMDALGENCIECLTSYTLDGQGGCLFPDTQMQTTVNNLSTAANTNTQSANNSTTSSSVTSTNPFPLDQNCQTPNNNSCALCKDGYILNPFNFSCWQIPKQCSTYNLTTGQCLTCQFGYNLFSGWCLPRANKTDPNCQISDINNFCIKCQNAYYSYRGICVNNQVMCAASEYRGGKCSSCYGGYVLFNGGCYLRSQQPACQTYDFQKTCVQCWNRFYLLGGVCMPVNPLCMGYNTNTGVCTDCISGYGLSSLTQQCTQIKPAPANCRKADPSGKCLTCSSRYYINSNSTCSSVAMLCQNFNAVGGQCQNCFPGYRLMSDSSCLKQTLALGCTAATSTGVCSACLPQYVLAIEGNCVTRDPSCLTYDGALCIKCKPLYYISQGRCIKETPKEKDPNCIINSLYNYCQQCTPGYFVFEGNCKLVDQQCKTYKQTNGECLSCYEGYRLNKGRCYLNTAITNCQTLKGLICEVCMPGYAVQQDGSCAL